jgi:hypothetical protein
METIAEIGSYYSFTNGFGYTSVIKVTRITDKSIFHISLLRDGSWSAHEFRISYNSLSVYQKITL